MQNQNALNAKKRNLNTTNTTKTKPSIINISADDTVAHDPKSYFNQTQYYN